MPKPNIPQMVAFLGLVNADCNYSAGLTHFFQGSCDCSNIDMGTASIKRSDERLKANDMIRWLCDVVQPAGSHESMTALNVSTHCPLREDDSRRTCISYENAKVIAKWLTPKAEEEGLSGDPSR